VSTRAAKALIVGAGVGGLAAALALRAAGYEVRVFEQAPDPRELGFALLLAPNALWALRELGLADRVRSAGFVLVSGEMRRPGGTVLRHFDAAKVAVALGEDSVCVLRQVLHGELLRALGPEVLSLGARVTGFRVDPDGVMLEREGAPPVHGTLIVGADGAASVIRKLLHPGDPPSRRAGLCGVRGLARNVAVRPGEPSGLQYFGRGVEAGVSRASTNDVYWYLSLPAPEPPAPRDADVRSLLDPHLAAFHPPFRALVASTSDGDLRMDDLRDREPLSEWGKGPVTLLGDAAHPMLPHAGQGAAQALEDAVVLGQALRGSTPVDVGLRRYEGARIPRTRAVIELARRNARMASLRSPLACWLRDVAIRAMPESVLLKSLIALGRPPELS
jgi:2-polyprenyl-6-methoxyphenol hydroxylase-like FAD-dependent oxidoreductase